MKKTIFAVTAFTALISFAIPTFAAPAVDVDHAPRIKVKDGTSTNWSGYAVETNLAAPQQNSVSDVKGTWVVPALDCSDGTTAYSSAWVGIDGYSSNTVEQIGTEHDCSGGNATYSAWYEMYPKWPVTLNARTYPLHAGDVISGEVAYVGRNFVLTLHNQNAGWTYSTTQKGNSAKRSSAEWVMEAPWSSGVLPLANFGTENFSNSSATINGHTGGINDSMWQNDPISMVNGSGGFKDTVSTTDGSNFSLTWVSH